MRGIKLFALLGVVIPTLAIDLSINTDTLFPTETPTGTTDPWQCVTESLVQYFVPPVPTGALEDAILNFGGVLFEETCTVTGLAMLDCPRPVHSRWCDITTTIAPELLPEYSSYAGDVFSWWTERSSTIADLVTDCPRGWYKAMTDRMGSAAWLDVGLAHAQCHANGVTGTSPTTTATATATATGSGPAEPEKTTTDATGFARRAGHVEVWILAMALATAAGLTAV